MYESMIKTYGNCYIPVAFGDKNKGKTTASEICVAAACQRGKVIKDITDAQLNKMLWAGLPFVYDDPSDIRQMKAFIINSFGGGVIGSSRMTSSTCTVPINCANTFIVQALAQEEERYERKSDAMYYFNTMHTLHKHLHDL